MESCLNICLSAMPSCPHIRLVIGRWLSSLQLCRIALSSISLMLFTSYREASQLTHHMWSQRLPFLQQNRQGVVFQYLTNCTLGQLIIVPGSQQHSIYLPVEQPIMCGYSHEYFNLELAFIMQNPVKCGCINKEQLITLQWPSLSKLTNGGPFIVMYKLEIKCCSVEFPQPYLGSALTTQLGQYELSK